MKIVKTPMCEMPPYQDLWAMVGGRLSAVHYHSAISAHFRTAIDNILKAIGVVYKK